MTKRPKRKSGKSPAQAPGEAQILEFIQSQPARVGKREIARAFGIRGSARIDLKKRLKEMAEKGLIARSRKRLHDPSCLPPVGVLEIFALDEEGLPLARPSSWDEAQSGPPPGVLIVGHARGSGKVPAAGIGDRVLARIAAVAGEPAYEGRVIRKLESRQVEVFGVFRKDPSGAAHVEPVNKKARNDIIISPGEEAGAQPGELVSVELHRGRALGLPHGKVIARHDKVDSHKSLSAIAIQEHGIPNRFGRDALREARALRQIATGERRDLTSRPLITIDPADARDHDDAIWAQPRKAAGRITGWDVTVAIADVGAYVAEGSPLDEEARTRGNSVYFPDRVVPMLPEELSAGLCSLKQGEPRPALAVHMRFDTDGNKREHRFERIMMKSAAGLSYSRAQAAIDGNPDSETKPLLEPVLRPLWGAYEALARARERRQPLELDLPERRILFDAKGHMRGVSVPERLTAHRLVEEFMIQANISAAETLKAKRAATIHRFHDEPSEEKRRALADFLKTLNIKLSPSGALRPHHFNDILNKAKGRNMDHLLSQVILRSQAQAIYSSELSGHFGLNLRDYVHFTSPIRRYADLEVHRTLAAILDGSWKPPDGARAEALAETASHISVTERRAVAAERDTMDRMTASFLAEKIGAQFEGRVSGVIRAGLFVELTETGADGFVPAATMQQDYFLFDEKSRALTGERTGETFGLGDSVTVKIAEVRPVAGAIRFEIVSPGRKGKAVRKTARRTASRGRPRGRGQKRRRRS